MYNYGTFCTNTGLYMMIVCAFTSAAYSRNPASPEKRLLHLQLLKMVLLSLHLQSSAPVLSLLSRLAYITLTGGTEVSFFRREEQEAWSLAPQTRQCALCSKHIRTPRAGTSKPRCSPVPCLWLRHGLKWFPHLSVLFLYDLVINVNCCIVLHFPTKSVVLFVCSFLWFMDDFLFTWCHFFVCMTSQTTGICAWHLNYLSFLRKPWGSSEDIFLSG